jgi:hypothetical protein
MQTSHGTMTLAWPIHRLPVEMRRLVYAIGSSLFLLSLACAKHLPTAPSELMTGIVVYEHANFDGASAHITADISDLTSFDGPCVEADDSPPVRTYSYSWNDCISSVRVAQGWSATLYRDDGYRDDSVTLTADMPNLQLAQHNCPHGGLNDCITSVRVRRSQ